MVFADYPDIMTIDEFNDLKGFLKQRNLSDPQMNRMKQLLADINVAKQAQGDCEIMTMQSLLWPRLIDIFFNHEISHEVFNAWFLVYTFDSSSDKIKAVDVMWDLLSERSASFKDYQKRKAAQLHSSSWWVNVQQPYGSKFEFWSDALPAIILLESMSTWCRALLALLLQQQPEFKKFVLFTAIFYVLFACVMTPAAAGMATYFAALCLMIGTLKPDQNSTPLETLVFRSVDVLKALWQALQGYIRIILYCVSKYSFKESTACSHPALKTALSSTIEQQDPAKSYQELAGSTALAYADGYSWKKIAMHF